MIIFFAVISLCNLRVDRYKKKEKPPRGGGCIMLLKKRVFMYIEIHVSRNKRLERKSKND